MSENGKTINDIVLEYFPNATDNEIEFIVWEKTGFPGFWNIPEDGATPEECFHKQLAEYAAEKANKAKVGPS